MATDLIRYDLLVQDALRGVVRTVLGDAAKNGLQGDHHFFITFRTDAPGLRLSDRMRERYPEEMTIILQHQFWDLAVMDQGFEVGLSFSNKPERLLVPFAAITTFHDPSVQFGLKFDLSQDAVPEPVPAEPATPLKGPSSKRTLAAVGLGPPAEKARPASVPALARPVEPSAEVAKAPDADAGGKSASAKRGGAGEASDPQKVVSIDAFRKKP